jgi:hypothetical protein
MTNLRSKKNLLRLGTGLWLGAQVGLFAGCSGAVAPGESSQAIVLGHAPDLPGCGAVHPSGGPLTVRPIENQDDFYVVYDGPEPLCADSQAGVAQLGPSVRFSAASDSLGNSNPMPGEPPVDNTGPASSNPMPGCPDPATSNPMPGYPGYGQPGYGASK